MDKIDILVDIGNTLEEWAFLLGIDERDEVQEFIKGVVVSLWKRDQASLKETNAELHRRKETKIFEQSLRSLMEKANSR